MVNYTVILNGNIYVFDGNVMKYTKDLVSAQRFGTDRRSHNYTHPTKSQDYKMYIG